MNEEEPQVADAVENFENDQSVDQSDTTSGKSKKDPLAGLRTLGKKISKNSKALAKKMHEGIERIKTRAASPSSTPNSRSRTSSRASSLNRSNKKLQNMKEVFDNFGKRLSLGRGQTPNFDDVFNDELDEDRFNAEDYAEDFDWGDSWASFDEFEMALSNLKEKSNGFQMLIHDICDADSKYAKAMRKLASNHLTAYQRTHGKMADQPHAEYTKHQAMKNLLETVNRVADHHELLSWSVNTFMENEFKAKLADANDKLHGISSANKKMKKDLNFQLGRVKAAKNEYNKRVSDLEQAENNYQKYQDERDEATRDIKEMDKLRVKVADKHALVTRAQEEHDQQVVAYNELQKQCYVHDLPALCRSQQEVHQFLTDQWAAALSEYSQKNHEKLTSDVEEFNKLDAIDPICKLLDSSILFKCAIQDNTLPADLNTIADVNSFQFPIAPPRSPAGAPPTPKTRKLSEAICLLSDSEKKERIDQLKKADDFIVLKDGRVFKVGTVTEDFDEDYKGAMAIKQGTFIGVTRAEAIKHKTEYNDGWIKVTNLETEACGYIPVAYMKFNSGQTV